VEAFTYRMGAHTTSDDPTRYRIAAEVEEWKLKDPIARVKVHMARTGKADEEFFRSVEAEADELAAHVRRACLEMPDPEPGQMFDHAYRDPHPLVDAERAEFEAYHAGFVQDVQEGAR
jgi:pyruvate dehydrogenase E1 component alpha subunit